MFFHTTRSTATEDQDNVHHVRQGFLGARNPIVVSSRRRVKPFRMDRMFFHTTRSTATEDQGNVHHVRQGFWGLGTQSSCRRVVV
jgi:hypothetical protein